MIEQDSSVTERKLIAARSILQTLLNAGHKAYFVGGFVRDRSLGEPVQDIDLATSALPQEVMALFPHTVATGLQHGTVSVIVNKVAYEVTTFRTESTYEQSRRPVEVTFIRDLHADLERRDFTMNAMAMDVEEQLIDPYEGQADIKLRIVRAVGNANERFAEDALRMLRCLRFAAQFNFQIEQDTWQALLTNRSKLEHISIERVRMELDKMLEGRNPVRSLELLTESGLFRYFRGMSALDHALTHWLNEGASKRSFIMDPHILQTATGRWAYLFFTVGVSSNVAADVCRKLTHSNQKTTDIVAVLRFMERLTVRISNLNLSHDNQDLPTWERIWKETVIEYNKQTAYDTLELIQNDCQGAKWWPYTATVATYGMQWLSQMKVFHTRDLAINGNDLMKHLQRKNGPWLRHLLTLLLRSVALDETTNDEASLLQLASHFNNEMDGGE